MLPCRATLPAIRREFVRDTAAVRNLESCRHSAPHLLFNFEAGAAGPKLPFRLQGDPSLNASPALARRERAKRHSTVNSWIDVFWRTFEAVREAGDGTGTGTGTGTTEPTAAHIIAAAQAVTAAQQGVRRRCVRNQ